MLVPFSTLYCRDNGQLLYIATPGAAISTWPPSEFNPPDEKYATLLFLSIAATAMIGGQLAG